MNPCWNHKNDVHLIELIEKYGFDWEKISRNLKRSIVSIKERYMNKLNPELKRSKFTEDEDIQIKELHNKLGNNWNMIAMNIPQRSALMIKHRFYSFIRKEVLKKKKNHFDLIKSASCENSLNEYRKIEYIEDKSNIISKIITSHKMTDNIESLKCNNILSTEDIIKINDGLKDQENIDQIFDNMYIHEKE